MRLETKTVGRRSSVGSNHRAGHLTPRELAGICDRADALFLRRRSARAQQTRSGAVRWFTRQLRRLKILYFCTDIAAAFSCGGTADGDGG